MSEVGDNAPTASRGALDRLIGELRPKLHRYCARMIGSVIDGEDVLQEALVKALDAYAGAGPIANPEGWLFRIAHNAALDFLRRRARLEAAHTDRDIDMIVDPGTTFGSREIAATSLRTFVRLPATQRASVILTDVLGYSAKEISGITDTTVPAVKAALNRGRTRLRELALEPEDQAVPELADIERARLAAYVDRFNARDFDAIRDMLADDVRLDLVSRAGMAGKQEVARYFGNYSSMHDWLLVPGFVDRRPALLVRDPGDPSGPPKYFILLQWAGNVVATIRDFRHAPYAIAGAEILVLGQAP
jgi:RNA polymerase sigma-70 factor (ECF subfamily)